MKPSYSDNWTKVYIGDALDCARALEPQSVHVLVCSPPYWGLRSYLDKDHPDKERELGTESTPEAYVEKLVEIFRALGKVLRDDGTLWLNLGSSYAANRSYQVAPTKWQSLDFAEANANKVPAGFKPKDLIPIPWLVGLALQRDGWYLRADNIWNKPNPMPSSVTDRPTISHEYMLLFSKKPRYFFDQKAVREPLSYPNAKSIYGTKRENLANAQYSHTGREYDASQYSGRNIRSVWTIATRPYANSHYAVFPPDLIYPCIKAGTSEKGVCGECGAPWVRIVEKTGETTQERARQNGHADHANAYGGASQNLDFKGSHWKLPPRESKTTGWQPSCNHNAEVVPATVLDPFVGSGTTLLASRKLGRKSCGFDLDERNLKLIEERLGYQEVLL